MYEMMYDVSIILYKVKAALTTICVLEVQKASSTGSCPNPAVYIRFNLEEGYLVPSLELLHQRQSRYSLLLLMSQPLRW